MIRFLVLIFLLQSLPSLAQMRPMPFAGGIPGKVQFQAIQLQRHQARTLLYREALEELRKNPAAADLSDCKAGQKPSEGQCLAPAGEPVRAVDGTLPTRRRLAVLIGNNDYVKPIPTLDTPIADVTRIADVLKSRFGYETRIVKDAGKAKIIETLNNVAEETRAEDSVLLFYAGHGYLLEDVNMGYWIPVDASVKTAKGWISNSDISKLLAAIGARQLILVSDSCYSGTLTKEQKFVSGSDLNTENVLRQRSVLVLTSGDDEPVSDEGKGGHSIFAWNLIRTLEKSGGLTPGSEIWSVVRKGVSDEYPQRPQYGAVMSAGHVEGGDYLFQAMR